MLPAPATPTGGRDGSSSSDRALWSSPETTPQPHRTRTGADDEPAPPSRSRSPPRTATGPREDGHRQSLFTDRSFDPTQAEADAGRPRRLDLDPVPDREDSGPSAPSTSGLRKPLLHTPPILLPSPAAVTSATLPPARTRPPRSPQPDLGLGPVPDSAGAATQTRHRQPDRERTARPRGAGIVASGSDSGPLQRPPPPPPRNSDALEGSLHTLETPPPPPPLPHSRLEPASHPLSQTASTDSTSSKSSSAASSSQQSVTSASVSENENAWAHSWIDPHDYDDENATALGFGSPLDPAAAAAAGAARVPGAPAAGPDPLWSLMASLGQESRVTPTAAPPDDAGGADQPRSQSQSPSQSGLQTGAEEATRATAEAAAAGGPHGRTRPDEEVKVTDGAGRGGEMAESNATGPAPIELPTIEPLFSSPSSSSSSRAGPAHRLERGRGRSSTRLDVVVDGDDSISTAPVAQPRDDADDLVSTRKEEEEEEEGAPAPPPPTTRPLSEFDWAAAYADGGGVTTPSPPLVTPAASLQPGAEAEDATAIATDSESPPAPAPAPAPLVQASSRRGVAPAAAASAPVSWEQERPEDRPQQKNESSSSSSAAAPPPSRVTLAASIDGSDSGGRGPDGELVRRPPNDLRLGSESGSSSGGIGSAAVEGAGPSDPLSRSGTGSAADSAPNDGDGIKAEVGEDEDPMAMFDSLIFHSDSASRLGFAEPVAPVPAVSGATTPRLWQAAESSSSLASPSPEPVLTTGTSVSAVGGGAAARAASPAGALNDTDGNGTSKRKGGPAPVVPVKSSRRASLLGRRRQSDSHALLQRAASASASASVPTASSVAAAGTRVRSPPGEGAARNSPSHARTGSVPPASHSPAGSEPALSSPMGRAPAGNGIAISPTPSRTSSTYDFAEIADVYARNSLYYPSPDATPRSSRMLDSEALKTTSVPDDGTTTSGTVTARQSVIEPAVVARDGDMRSSPTRPGDSARADAKARAAAFIEDLKRAKANATESAPIGADLGNIGQTDPDLPGVAASDMSTRPQLAMVSPERTPPLPPPSSAKRPPLEGSASSSGLQRPASVAIPRSTTTLSLVSPSRRSSVHALASFEPQAVPEQRPRLLRRRPLPQAVIIAAEMKQARTSRERCRVYADKLNDLAREQSRLDEWIVATSDVRSFSCEPREVVASSPKRNRWIRQESSVATFAPRGDGYRAREIARGTFSPHDLSPSAPFPGVLNLTPTRSGSHTSLASSVALGSGKSFFSALGRGTLGRRMSKREHGGPSSSRSSTKSALRATISGPVQVLSSTNSGLAPVSDGPYRPSHGVANARASFDSRRSSPARSPQASRASFSFGGGSYSSPAAGAASLPPSASSTSSGSFAATSIPTFQVTRGSVYYEDGGKTAGSQVGDLDEEKLDRLADILPQASRAELAAALDAAGGDDVLAISVYLSSESG